MTDLDLDSIEAAASNAAQIGSGIDPGVATALVAEVRRLREQFARQEHAHGETIDDRDQIHDIADKLAYAVAPIEVIGEHSSMNCPWHNALDLITPVAEVDKLRKELAEYEPLNPQQCPAGKRADWLIDSEYAHACPWCQIEELKNAAAGCV